MCCWKALYISAIHKYAGKSYFTDYPLICLITAAMKSQCGEDIWLWWTLFYSGKVWKRLCPVTVAPHRYNAFQNYLCPGASVRWGEVFVRGALCPGGLFRGVVVSVQGWWSLSRGGLCPGGSLSGGTLLGRPPCGRTDTCEIITLPQPSFTGGNK